MRCRRNFDDGGGDTFVPAAQGAVGASSLELFMAGLFGALGTLI